MVTSLQCNKRERERKQTPGTRLSIHPAAAAAAAAVFIHWIPLTPDDQGQKGQEGQEKCECVCECVCVQRKSQSLTNERTMENHESVPEADEEIASL